jgi:hypothetical protein
MKTVFTNTDTMHTFAQQTQYEGRNATNTIFFEGNKIYSYGYHYLLGKFLDPNTILINDKGYSNTTSKHISMLIGATSQYKQYYTTKTDLQYVYSTINALKVKLSKARKPQIYLNEITSLWYSLNTFINDRGLKETKKQKEYKELKKFVSSLEKLGTLDQLKEWNKEQQRLKKLKEQKTLKEKIHKFLTYEINYFRVGDKDYLRVSKDKEYIETSQGVKVEISEAKRYLNLLRSGVNMRGEKISHYTTINFDKLLRIGCHNIDKKQIKYISNLI